MPESQAPVAPKDARAEAGVPEVPHDSPGVVEPQPMDLPVTAPPASRLAKRRDGARQDAPPAVLLGRHEHHPIVSFPASLARHGVVEASGLQEVEDEVSSRMQSIEHPAEQSPQLESSVSRIDRVREALAGRSDGVARGNLGLEIGPAPERGGRRTPSRDREHSARDVDADNVVTRVGQRAGQDSAAATEIHDEPALDAASFEQGEQLRRGLMGEAAEPVVVDVGEVSAVGERLHRDLARSRPAGRRLPCPLSLIASGTASVSSGEPILSTEYGPCTRVYL